MANTPESPYEGSRSAGYDCQLHYGECRNYTALEKRLEKIDGNGGWMEKTDERYGKINSKINGIFWAVAVLWPIVQVIILFWGRAK